MEKRFAQFGGVGGQYAPYAPGGSPNFRGGPSGFAGYGVNNFSGEMSLDDLMGLNRKPDILSFERPFETLLETFHERAEKDAEPYLLDFDERTKLNKKKKIRLKEQYLKDLAKGKYDKKLDKKIPEKTKTVEELLSEFRKNENIDFSKFASTKLANYYREKISPPLLTEFLPTVEEHAAEDDPLSLTNARLTQPFLGPYDAIYRTRAEMDDYFKQEQNPQRVDMHAGVPILPDAWQPGTEPSFPISRPKNELPSLVTEKAKNNNQSYEKKLEQMKQGLQDIGGRETNLQDTLDWDRMIKGNWPLRNMANQTPYENSTLGDYSQSDTLTNASEATISNNPYFGVID